MSGCQHWLGHRFEPRYDEAPPFVKNAEYYIADELAKIIKSATKKTYVHDICVRCGETKKRSAAQSNSGGGE